MAGKTCSEPVISIDFYPTLLELTGTEGDDEHNRKIDGVSLVPLLGDCTAGLSRDSICWHDSHYNVLLGVPHSSIRSGDYKLIEFFEDDHIELYDLENDLSETENLSAAMPEKTAELHEKLMHWRGRVDAQLPVRKEIEAN